MLKDSANSQPRQLTPRQAAYEWAQTFVSDPEIRARGVIAAGFDRDKQDREYLRVFVKQGANIGDWRKFPVGLYGIPIEYIETPEDFGSR